MLVLSRKTGEEIHIGPDITITVVHLNPYSVRIGITAPSGVTIWRDELDPKPRPDQASGVA